MIRGKLSILSVSLLALFCAACSSSSGGGETKPIVSPNDTSRLNTPNVDVVFKGTNNNKDDANSYRDINGKTPADLQNEYLSSGSTSSNATDNATETKVADADKSQLTGYTFTAPWGVDRDKEDPLLKPKEVKKISQTASELTNEADYDKLTIQTSIAKDYSNNDFTSDLSGDLSISNPGDDWIELDSESSSNVEGVEGVTHSVHYKEADHLYKGSHLIDSYDFGHVQFGALAFISKDNSNSILARKEYSLFYRGKDLSQNLPAGSLHYEGGWYFATNSFENNGRSGAFQDINNSGKAPPKASFDADFGKKKITGQFTSHDENYGSLDLTMNADIKGNGFSGTATVTKAESSELFPKRFSSLAKDSTVQAKGAFYGENAQELGGYLKKDDDFAAVFAAKANQSSGEDEESNDPSTDTQEAEKLTIAKTIADGDNVSVTDQEIKNGLDFLSLGDGVELNLAQMVLNEENSDLTLDDRKSKDSAKYAVCCSYEKGEIPFEFLSFGEYWKRGQGNYTESGPTDAINQSGLFLQGYLTPKESMPTSGTVYFAGKWYGGAKNDQLAYAAHYQDARYKADFTNKKLSGYLYSQAENLSKNVQDDIASVQKQGDAFKGIKFEDATIEGNHFTGTASYNLPNQNAENLDTSAQSNIKGSDAQVSGNFFGNRAHPANELGGTVVGNTSKLKAVFAGKQVK